MPVKPGDCPRRRALGPFDGRLDVVVGVERRGEDLDVPVRLGDRYPSVGRHGHGRGGRCQGRGRGGRAGILKGRQEARLRAGAVSQPHGRDGEKQFLRGVCSRECLQPDTLSVRLHRGGRRVIAAAHREGARNRGEG